MVVLIQQLLISYDIGVYGYVFVVGSQDIEALRPVLGGGGSQILAIWHGTGLFVPQRSVSRSIEREV
jgi:hypothetical protein